VRIAAAFLLVVLLAGAAPAAKTLEVYVIDVEGGKALLVVSPSGESMLVDAGWPGYNGRDANRIAEAAQAAGLKQIDYFVASHLDVDHVGDLAALLSEIPIRHIVDNGPLQTSGKGVEKRYQAYAEVRDKMDHTTVKPGDRLPIKGVEVQVVAAAAKVIGKPLKGGGSPNPACAGAAQPDEIKADLEDNMSIGLLYTLGKFRMLDLADLEAHYEYLLACPNNLVGPVDVYQVSVHGQAKGSSPVLHAALRARVAILNNGARKGGDAASWEPLRSAPGMEDIWQVHYSLNAPKESNPAEDFIANVDPNCQGKWIKLSARDDGTFTVSNGRNGFEKTYKPRK